MSTKIDLVGRRYGKLLILKEVSTPPGKPLKWKCKCDCGKITISIGNNIKVGKTKSCGCMVHKPRPSSMAHGLGKTKAGRRFYQLPKNQLCEHWCGTKGIVHFVEDMENPSNHTDKLIRLNSNKDYSKENCKWIPAEQFYAHRIGGRLIDCFGTMLTMSQASKEYEILRTTLFMRLKTGMRVERALLLKVEFQNKW